MRAEFVRIFLTCPKRIVLADRASHWTTIRRLLTAIRAVSCWVGRVKVFSRNRLIKWTWVWLQIIFRFFRVKLRLLLMLDSVLCFQRRCMVVTQYTWIWIFIVSPLFLVEPFKDPFILFFLACILSWIRVINALHITVILRASWFFFYSDHWSKPSKLLNRGDLLTPLSLILAQHLASPSAVIWKLTWCREIRGRWIQLIHLDARDPCS